MSLHFLQPHWLWIGAAACLALVALQIHADRRRQRALALLAGASLQSTVSLSRRRLRQALTLMGTALLFVAIARPVAGFRWESSPHRGVDLMFAVDTSRSMLAADVRPDRLTRAKLAVTDLVRKLDGDRVGLIAFAGNAFVQTPMTVDRGVFFESLDALDTNVIPRGGTDLSSALRAAEQAMASEPDHQKVLFLLSDGEDLDGNVIAAAEAAAKQGLTLFTLGIGTPAGELITTRDGQVVRSRLDEPMLRRMAQLTGGDYRALGADGNGLEALYSEARRHLNPATQNEERHKVFHERFQLPLALALTLLGLELVMSERRRRRGLSGVAATAMLALAIVPLSAKANGVQDYNQGIETYRKGDFPAAQQQFEHSLHTDDPALQENAYYDLGNTRYRTGERTLSDKPEATIAEWKEALRAYDAALALQRDDGDAKFNRDLVARKLAALEKQQQQKQQEQQQKSQPQKSGSSEKNELKNGQGAPQAASQGNSGSPQEAQGQPSQAEAKNSQSPQSGKQEHQAGDQTQKPGAEGKPNETAQQTPNQDPEAPDATRRADPKPSSSSTGKATAAAEAKEHEERTADAARRAAGQLTRSEATQLLDSMQSDLKPLPIRGARADRRDSPLKDW
jgi:Ca-activated chloride channel family protein